ncbi:alpha/beta fold hydrolase [Pimelobacter simplex]|uniref:alpha/beta fold hydrolase n=1 Tax=Nocardioides simplex TaxID=2045 RepID=UPI003AB0222A
MSQTPQGESTWAPTRDGRTLHAVVLPARSPTAADRRPVTVVFEAGAAAARWSWAAVQPPVADFATAVAYDRSGLGRSAPDPAGRTLSRMADDLNDLLDHLQEEAPAGRRFVLVGHSAGGPVVRLAAARRPARIGGLVLVDPTDEAAAVLFGPRFRRLERTALAVGGALAKAGLLRFVYRGLVRSSPDDVRPALLAEAFTVQVMATSREQARTVSGARTGDGMSAAIRAEANAAHAVRAARSPYGRHVLAERSGHYVPLTDPELIVEEVRRLVHRTEGLAPD